MIGLEGFRKNFLCGVLGLYRGGALRKMASLRRKRASPVQASRPPKKKRVASFGAEEKKEKTKRRGEERRTPTIEGGSFHTHFVN
jgi:hypothetical protein